MFLLNVLALIVIIGLLGWLGYHVIKALFVAFYWLSKFSFEAGCWCVKASLFPVLVPGVYFWRLWRLRRCQVIRVTLPPVVEQERQLRLWLDSRANPDFSLKRVPESGPDLDLFKLAQFGEQALFDKDIFRHA